MDRSWRLEEWNIWGQEMPRDRIFLANFLQNKETKWSLWWTIQIQIQIQSS